MQAPEDAREPCAPPAAVLVRHKLSEMNASRPVATTAASLRSSPTAKEGQGAASPPHSPRVLRSHFLKYYSDINELLMASELPPTHTSSVYAAEAAAARADKERLVSEHAAEAAAARADKERLRQQVTALQGSHLLQLESQVAGLAEQLELLHGHVGRLEAVNEQRDVIPSPAPSLQPAAPTDQAPAEALAQVEAVRRACDELEDRVDTLNMFHAGRAEEIESLRRHVERHWAELDGARQTVLKQAAELAAVTIDRDLLAAELARTVAERGGSEFASREDGTTATHNVR